MREEEELGLAAGPQAPMCLSKDPVLGTPLPPKETGPTSEQRDWKERVEDGGLAAAALAPTRLLPAPALAELSGFQQQGEGWGSKKEHCSTRKAETHLPK